MAATAPWALAHGKSNVVAPANASKVVPTRRARDIGKGCLHLSLDMRAILARYLTLVIKALRLGTRERFLPYTPAMILIGMLDSPYVRRCAISMKMMGIAFEHRPVSVFRHFEEFRKVNPVVKAPTLVCDDGTILMDSTLILDYLEATVDPAARLLPVDLDGRRRALHVIGFALAAADKCVNIVYENEQRPKDKIHPAWLERVVGQANTAFAQLEPMAARAKPWLHGDRFTAADVMTAVAWRFGQYYNAAEIPAAQYPALVDYSRRAESLPEFASTPLD